jgi:hypothetical protein
MMLMLKASVPQRSLFLEDSSSKIKILFSVGTDSSGPEVGAMLGEDGLAETKQGKLVRGFVFLKLSCEELLVSKFSLDKVMCRE